MKSLYLLIVNILLVSTISYGQIKNSTTNMVKIHGNCEMCKSTIEKAGNKKNESKISWDKSTQTATIEFDKEKTDLNDVLKRVALAGYDNESFLAPDATYNSLPMCCQYDRPAKPTSNMAQQDDNHQHMSNTDEVNESQLASIFNSYFLIKYALVKSDYNQAKSEANNLSLAIQQVNMTKLSTKEHNEWMKIKNNLLVSAKKIASEKNIAKQRDAFSSLSENIYPLIKVSNLNKTVYYANCPMFNNGKGANWLSLQENIKNPYYGSQMLTCGSNIDTIAHQK